jgi:hypothetical protein
MATITCPSCRQTFEGVVDPLGVCPLCGGSLAPPPQTFDQAAGIDLRQVAKRQRALLWYILASLTIQLWFIIPIVSLPPIADVAIAIIFWVVQIFIIIGVVRLLAAMSVHIIWRILYIVLLFAPCINLLVLLVINRRATRALRNAGLRVGLMGVPDEQVVRRLSVHLCKVCSYDLTGNISGRCPECGTPIRG